MKEEKIESLKQELKSHITPLISNGVMVTFPTIAPHWIW
jgi:hypothetical protein